MNIDILLIWAVATYCFFPKNIMANRKMKIDGMYFGLLVDVF